MRESRGPLYLREYGRNLQNIVAHIDQVKDKDEKKRLAELAVELMKQINPNMTDSSDNNQVVWDHLYMMSDYQLDVEGPFPKPEREVVQAKPKRLRYPSQRIKFRHYGKNVESLINETLEIKDAEERKSAEIYLARLMKSFYITWNKENVDDEVIIEHLGQMSNYQIKLNIDEVRENRLLEVQTRASNPNRSNTSARSNNRRKGGGGRRRRN
ncbi:DUF4290 domain-containing protein [Hyphobacterium sp. CCMP332]|nr:DUF4290 domain-containing protein [Hyphobacterium sp. CCMP332]